MPNSGEGSALATTFRQCRTYRLLRPSPSLESFYRRYRRKREEHLFVSCRRSRTATVRREFPRCPQNRLGSPGTRQNWGHIYGYCITAGCTWQTVLRSCSYLQKLLCRLSYLLPARPDGFLKSFHSWTTKALCMLKAQLSSGDGSPYHY